MADERYRVELLAHHHNRADFSSGVGPLDRYFQERAGQDVRRYAAAAYVLYDTQMDFVAGFYTLSATSIQSASLPDVFRRTLPRYPSLPAFLLGRLALDSRYQGQGLGAILLGNALRRLLAVSEQVRGIAAIVDAKDVAARRFYHRHGFEPVIGDEDRLIIPMQRIARS